jgi:hypothetical protein
VFRPNEKQDPGILSKQNGCDGRRDCVRWSLFPSIYQSPGPTEPVWSRRFKFLTVANSILFALGADQWPASLIITVNPTLSSWYAALVY